MKHFYGAGRIWRNTTKDCQTAVAPSEEDDVKVISVPLLQSVVAENTVLTCWIVRQIFTFNYLVLRLNKYILGSSICEGMTIKLSFPLYRTGMRKWKGSNTDRVTWGQKRPLFASPETLVLFFCFWRGANYENLQGTTSPRPLVLKPNTKDLWCLSSLGDHTRYMQTSTDMNVLVCVCVAGYHRSTTQCAYVLNYWSLSSQPVMFSRRNLSPIFR